MCWGDQKVRVFVAIELPEQLKKYLAEVVSVLATSRVDAKWVNAENLHITLSFLGDVDDDRLPEISAVLEKLSKHQNSFSVNVSGFQFFPPRGVPRILFVETDQQERLKWLAEELQGELEKLGYAKEGRFRSHITLARFRAGRNIGKLMQLLEQVKLSGSFSVAALTFYKSTLTASGPIYEVLCRVKFKDQESYAGEESHLLD